jgi:high affinity sulfate transporter 1
MKTQPKSGGKLFQIGFFQGLLPWNAKLSTEILAGITLAALAIPEVMGYTKIAGTPVITGLYTMLLPMLLFAFLGSSRHLVVGADSATAAILAAGLAGMAIVRSAEWVALAGVLALLVAAFLLLARLARLGFLANFLSRTVLIGFLSGVGIQVALSQLSGLFGLPGPPPSDALEQVASFFSELGSTSWPTLTVAVSVLALILLARRFSPQIPAALIALVGSIAVAWIFDLGNHGVALLGTIPVGLPHLGLPQVNWSWPLIQKLVPTAFAMLIVILAQSAATSRAYAERLNEPFDENVDLVGLAFANLGAGLSGTFVVNGSPTKTQMVQSAGGTTQAAQITASVVVLLVLLFLTGPLAHLPVAVLSAVVFLIGVELVDYRGMKRVFRERPYEFWVALITAGTVIFVGVEQSILLAIFLSLLVHTRHGYRVTNVLLVTGATGWHQRPLASAEAAVEGLVIYRFLHNLYYANAHVLEHDLTDLVLKQKSLKWLCIDLAAVNDVDFTAAEVLRALGERLKAQGIGVVFSELVDSTQHGFERSGLVDFFGPQAFFPTLDSVVVAYQKKFSSVNLP